MNLRINTVYSLATKNPRALWLKSNTHALCPGRTLPLSQDMFFSARRGNGVWNCFKCVLIAVQFLMVGTCWADSYSEVAADLRGNAETVTRAARTNPAIGQGIAARLSSQGSQFSEPEFQAHPWAEGNNDWEQVWKVDDDATIKKGFSEYRSECFDMQVLGCCCRDSCDNCPWAYIGYWWPEAVISLNNYCVSALMGPAGSVVTDSNGSTVNNPPGYASSGLSNGATMDFHGGCFRDQESWRDAIDSMLGPQVGAKIRAGFPGAGIGGGLPQTFPAGLRQRPHRGNSAVTSVGSIGGFGIETTNLEAHMYRTWADVEASRGSFNPLAGFAECFSPKCVRPWIGSDIWPRMMTENARRDMPARWRLPERSAERVNDGQSCNSRYRQEWDGVPEMATFSENDVPQNFNKLIRGTCASFRASDGGLAALNWKNPIDQAVPGNRLGIIPQDSPQHAQNCLQPEVGQVYPLVGEYQSDSESAGAIGTALRANEWASWCKWDDSMRSNIFNYKGAAYSSLHSSTQGKVRVAMNTNRSSGYFWGPRANTYVAWPTPPDKLQRIFPVKGPSDTCFTADEADKRLRPDLFPTGLYDGNDQGETRIVIWNYRTCCVCPSCDPSEAISCVPVTE